MPHVITLGSGTNIAEETDDDPNGGIIIIARDGPFMTEFKIKKGGTAPPPPTLMTDMKIKKDGTDPPPTLIIEFKIKKGGTAPPPTSTLTLEAQINACFAKIYNLTRSEFETVLENSPIIDDKLKDMALDKFDLL
jgi:hypothetical protein